MDKSARDRDKKILQELCNNYEVELSTVEELLLIEKQNRFRERRRGIYDSLRDCIRDSLSKDEN